jgi:GGDEF domain-containing protein
MKPSLLLDRLSGNERFPAFLLLANLADTKRRNSHLGIPVVDEDIRLFDELAGANLSSEERGARVGGDQWLLLAADPGNLVEPIVSRYTSETPYRAGWRGVATRRGERREHDELISTTMTRAARFLTVKIATPLDVVSQAEQLDAQIGHYGVNRCYFLGEPQGRAATRWCCVGEYPESPGFCPFCRGASFNWIDGDSNV